MTLNEKIEAAKKIREIIDEKEGLMDVYIVLGKLHETTSKISIATSIINDKERLEGMYNIEEVEARVSESSKGTEKAEECIEQLEKSVKKVGDRYVELFENRLFSIIENYEENLEKTKEVVRKDNINEFGFMTDMINTMKKLPDMWKIYKSHKDRRDEDIEYEQEELEGAMNGIMNTFNDEKYPGKAYR